MNEYHLPGHNFTGPGTRLTERLEGGAPRSRPVNRVDELSLDHDIYYQFSENAVDTLRADLTYIEGGIKIALGPGSTFRERGEAILVTSIMGVKVVSDISLQPARLGLKMVKQLRRLRGVL